jgi:hypothetical protein
VNDESKEPDAFASGSFSVQLKTVTLETKFNAGTPIA